MHSVIAIAKSRYIDKGRKTCERKLLEMRALRNSKISGTWIISAAVSLGNASDSGNSEFVHSGQNVGNVGATNTRKYKSCTSDQVEH